MILLYLGDSWRRTLRGNINPVPGITSQIFHNSRTNGNRHLLQFMSNLHHPYLSFHFIPHHLDPPPFRFAPSWLPYSTPVQHAIRCCAAIILFYSELQIISRLFMRVYYSCEVNLRRVSSSSSTSQLRKRNSLQHGKNITNNTKKITG